MSFFVANTRFVVTPNPGIGVIGTFSMNLPKELSRDWLSNGRFTQNLDQICVLPKDPRLAASMLTLDELRSYLLNEKHLDAAFEYYMQWLITPDAQRARIVQASKPRAFEEKDSREC